MAPPPASSKPRAVLRLWAVALVLSTALAAAGRRWPASPAPDPRWIAGLVLGVPLLVALVVLVRWPLPLESSPAAGRRGESVD
jgi:hypothetical protein